MCKIHKWLGVSAGLFIAVWFISGILMVLPLGTLPALVQKRPEINFEEFTLSPAQAIVALNQVTREPVQVTSVSFTRIRHTLAYKISARSGRSFLVDARSGEVLTITRQFAEQIARDDLSSEAPVLDVSLITSPGLPYGKGPLPVYRVVFDDSQRTISFVSLNDGRVRRTDHWSRLRDTILHLHTLDTLIIDQEGLRKALLVFLSLLGLAAIGAGYYLALPRRRYRKALPQK